ncbi:MAG: helix-turn-helix domain-containing protein [Pseudomonadota bacterium]
MSTSKRLTSADAVLEAAFEILAEDPTASLADIAERAGVGRATLHRLFSGRDDLMHSLAQRAVREMDEAAERACEGVESHAEALRLTLVAIIPLGDRYGFLLREPLDDDPKISAEFERQLQEIRDAVNGAKEEGVFDAAVPTEWIVQAYDHLVYAGWEIIRDGHATHEQAANLAWRTLTKGLGAVQ